MRKVALTQRHFKDSSFDFSRQRSLWRGANNNNKNTRVHHHHHQRPAKPLPRYPTRRMVLPQSQSYLVLGPGPVLPSPMGNERVATTCSGSANVVHASKPLGGCDVVTVDWHGLIIGSAKLQDPSAKG